MTDTLTKPVLSDATLDKYLTVRAVEPLMGAVAETVKAHIENIVRPLEQRITELEARPSLKYSGVFDAGRQYGPGEFTTFRGSLWHCNETTHGETPGTGTKWVLAVKHGKDAR
jgi:hypothetical protein